jgi:hypothetical protein
MMRPVKPVSRGLFGAALLVFAALAARGFAL